MSKKLRREPIYIAPDILGWLDESLMPHVIDQRSNEFLDPHDINDKITIYERQVNEWFLIPATNFTRYNNKNKGFIILMICLSYLEGAEQIREGQSSYNNSSSSFFISAINRLYPNVYSQSQLRSFYSQARCGLFHNGMVEGKIIINSTFPVSLEFTDENEIRINPKSFLKDIKKDFKLLLEELRSNQQSGDRFDRMYSNL